MEFWNLYGIYNLHNYLSISKSDIRKFGYKLTISKHRQLLRVLKYLDISQFFYK